MRMSRGRGMLVLSRRPYEAIKIGHDIEIRVFRINDGTVRFGLIAPREISILRGEILSRPDFDPHFKPPPKKNRPRR